MTKMTERFVDINGNQVMDLTPDMNRALALVDLDVLVKLTSNLHKGSSRMVKNDLIAELQSTSNTHDSLTQLQQLVHICEEFVAFHKTVNLIQEIEHPLNNRAVANPEPIRGKDISDIT